MDQRTLNTLYGLGLGALLGGGTGFLFSNDKNKLFNTIAGITFGSTAGGVGGYYLGDSVRNLLNLQSGWLAQFNPFYSDNTAMPAAEQKISPSIPASISGLIGAVSGGAIGRAKANEHIKKQIVSARDDIEKYLRRFLKYGPVKIGPGRIEGSNIVFDINHVQPDGFKYKGPISVNFQPPAASRALKSKSTALGALIGSTVSIPTYFSFAGANRE